MPALLRLAPTMVAIVLASAACFDPRCEGSTEPGLIAAPCPVPVIEPSRPVVDAGNSVTRRDAGVTRRDAGSSIDGGRDAGPTEPPADAGVVFQPESSSAISIRHTRLGGASAERWATHASARFGSSPPRRWEDLGCERLVHGTCQNVRCLEAAFDAGNDPSPQPAVSAGTLSFSGLPQLASAEPQSAGAGGMYYSEYAEGLSWEGGERITAMASGSAQLPAFATPTLTAPSVLELTPPACPGGRCGTISRTSPLTFVVDGAMPPSSRTGTLRVSIWSVAGFDHSFTECLFPASSSRVTIPPEAMRLLVRSGPTPVPMPLGTALRVDNLTTTTFDVQGRSVTFTLRHELEVGDVEVR